MKKIAVNNKVFYEERYQDGYMEDWPVSKKERVFQIIESLNLPSTGRALDYGCGNGTFTKVLKMALPDWEVYGSDISKTALVNASISNKECHFFYLDDVSIDEKEAYFDFIFSHHVLEHVEDISDALSTISKLAASEAKMLHILPCGNINSYEHKIANSTLDGINENNGNRYHFEDIGHLRRLNYSDLKNSFAKHRFTPELTLYANQYWGAVEWITQTKTSVVFKVANPIKGKTFKNRFFLFVEMLKLLLLNLLQLPSTYSNKIMLKKLSRKFPYSIIKGILVIPKFFSDFVYKAINNRSLKEWELKKKELNGSEIYLIVKR